MSIFPTRVLFATDGSINAELAGRTAVALAERTGSELHVVHVAYLLPASSELSYISSREYERAYKEAKQEAQKLLDEQVRTIQERAGRKIAEPHLVIGRPDEEVIRLSEELGAGLIVVGSRGLGGIKRALVGSVSESVVRHSHCPVLVVRGEKDRLPVFSLKRILLGTDGSEEATLAARTASDLAQKMGSELHVVLVELSTAYVGMGPPEIADIPAPEQEELDEEAQSLLDTQVRQIEADGGTVTRAHLRVGRSDVQIVALAEELGAGLIVVGSRGLGGIRRALIGSVSDSVVRHAHCPVLVVRKEEPHKEEPDEDMMLA